MSQYDEYNKRVIKKSLYKTITWMDIERATAATWLATCFLLFMLTAFTGKSLLLPTVFIPIGFIGIHILQKITEYDSKFFMVIIKRIAVQDVYPPFINSVEKYNVTNTKL